MKGGIYVKDQLTLSNINLFAILRNLEDLCDLDKECKDLIKGKNLAIQFVVKNGPKALMTFKDGKCTVTEGEGKANMKLFFKSPQHLNEMVDGKANPIPLKGFLHISFLKNEFTKITDKLAFYLKPTEELLKGEEYFKINTILTFYAAFMALEQIGNFDEVGRLNAKRMPDGIMSIEVLQGGPAVNLKVSKGHLKVTKGAATDPRALMRFDTLKTANDLLNGKVDSYSCIAVEKVTINGFIPLIDNFNKLLSQVSGYLK